MSATNKFLKHKLFVISGPSGSGKGTLIKKLLCIREDLALSVSVTTRKPRATELEGKEYYFKNSEEFEELIKGNKFLESARVHGFCYGTLKEEVNSRLSAGYDVILEIDPQGAVQVKNNRQDAVLIFVQPPSLEIAKQRLRARGTDTEHEIEVRMKTAKEELKQVNVYDYVIINNQINKSVERLNSLIEKERSK